MSASIPFVSSYNLGLPIEERLCHKALRSTEAAETLTMTAVHALTCTYHFNKSWQRKCREFRLQ